MPNHVTNRLIATGSPADIAAFRALLIDDAPDFDNIKPMPECLKNSESGSKADLGAKLLMQAHANPFGPGMDLTLYPAELERMRQVTGMPSARFTDVARAYLALNPAIEEAGRNQLRCIVETGHPSWYSWSIEHWGTKWRAYSGEVIDGYSADRHEVTFETAWSTPLPIYHALADMLPGVRFEIVAFDEGWNFASQIVMHGQQRDVAETAELATKEMYARVYGREYEDEDAEA